MSEWLKGYLTGWAVGVFSAIVGSIIALVLIK
jgi:hypothetical protein